MSRLSGTIFEEANEAEQDISIDEWHGGYRTSTSSRQVWFDGREMMSGREDEV